MLTEMPRQRVHPASTASTPALGEKSPGLGWGRSRSSSALGTQASLGGRHIPRGLACLYVAFFDVQRGGRGQLEGFPTCCFPLVMVSKQRAARCRHAWSR